MGDTSGGDRNGEMNIQGNSRTITRDGFGSGSSGCEWMDDMKHSCYSQKCIAT